MAFSRFEGSSIKNMPVFQDGESVLTFQGLLMRKALCIWVTVENEQVKYLVRYPSESGFGPARNGAVASPSAPLIRPSLAPSAPSGPRALPTQDITMGLRIPPGSCYSHPKTLGRGNTILRSLNPLPVAPTAFYKDHFYPLVPSGWVYEWIPERKILRYSAAYMQRDGSAYILLQMAAERKSHDGLPITSSPSSGHFTPGECSTAEGEMVQPSLESGRALAQGRGSTPLKDQIAAAGPGKKFMNRREVHLQLPYTLSPLLVHDWELMTLKKKLFKLPAKKNVETILAEYAAFKPHLQSTDKYAINGLVSLIKEYFDLVLGTQLLYSFERPQYAEMLTRYPSCQMSQIYGGAHLLRIFPQMGPMLASTPLDDSSLNVLMGHLQDFLEYLASNPSQLFTVATDYQEASPEYQKEAE